VFNFIDKNGNGKLQKEEVIQIIKSFFLNDLLLTKRGGHSNYQKSDPYCIYSQTLNVF